jgi:hypothetical protein
VLDFGLRGDLPGRQLLFLTGYGILFGVLAIHGYRRDETRQYR